MSTVKKINIQSLSQSKRILLAEGQNGLEMTDSQRKLLDARMATSTASPNEGFSWEEVKGDGNT